MPFPKDFLNTVLDRISVSDVVSRYVKLQKRGGNFIGLCPFHHEKTPSFTVNDDKGFYHCFGCGAHGNAINFEMHLNNYSFFDVIQNFADQLGLQLPTVNEVDREKEKNRALYYNIMEKAGEFFQKNLYSNIGQTALMYLQNQRRLNNETIRSFKLGYAPKGNKLFNFFKENNIDINKLFELGLIQKSEKYGIHDTFFDRVIFPIQDSRGRIIAFGGRVLNDGLPKYINSPETPLFKKNHVLYGIAQARETTYTDKRIIAVEGYIDVISMVSAGITSVVAPLGTAIGENHFQTLWKLNDKPILCFDGDLAGRKAAIRASFLALPFLKAGKSLQIAILPDGYDPDDLIKQKGVNILNNILNSSKTLIDIIWETLLDKESLDTPEDKAKFEIEINKYCETIKDQYVKKFYLKELRNRMWEILKKSSVLKQSIDEKFNKIKLLKDINIEQNSIKLIANTSFDSILTVLAHIISFPDLALPYIEEKNLFFVKNDKINKFISLIFSTISINSNNINTDVLINNLKQYEFINILDQITKRISLNKKIKKDIAKAELYIFIKNKEKDLLISEIQKEKDKTKLEILYKDKKRIDDEIIKAQNLILNLD